MKTVILAGGLGTRMGEEVEARPKPMVEIGGRPILWHIMKLYERHGFSDFIICLGYKGRVIKEYFLNYRLTAPEIQLDMTTGLSVSNSGIAPWKLTLVETGEGTGTGERLRRIRHHLPTDKPFMLTYGDGIGNIDIKKLIAHHQHTKKLATVTAVGAPARFGALNLARDGSTVFSFREKPKVQHDWINGGFFVLEPQVFDYIPDDPAAMWEMTALGDLADAGQLSAFFHDGFWQCMDTPRDRQYLEELWRSGAAPWTQGRGAPCKA